MVGIPRWRLDLATHQQRVLMRHEQFPVERDCRPTGPVHQRIVRRYAFGSALLPQYPGIYYLIALAVILLIKPQGLLGREQMV